MALRIPTRFTPSQIALIARAETRLAYRAVPSVLRQVLPIVAWGVASIVLGALIGLSAVILPPMGAFGIVAAAGLVLLWVMPDLPLVSPRFIRKAFFVMLVVDVAVPFYYTIQFPGTPWISARRLATFALVAPFVVAVAASSDVRRQIMERARASLPIFICAAGFLTMAGLSILTSVTPEESFSALTDLILSCYVPFLALIYIAKDKTDLILILKILCFCALFITGAAVVEFVTQRNFFVQIFPTSMLNSLISSNPSLEQLLPGLQHYRNGRYRSQSIFVTPLSFSEFEIIVIPIGLFFALHRKGWFEKALGWAVVIGGVVGIFCSGSRGGWLGVLVSLPLFVAMWSIRKAMHTKGSLAPAIVGLIGSMGFLCLIGLLAFSHQAHDMVMGGAAQANSTQARFDQWAAGMKYIISNPITGHGFASGGTIFQDYTIDSYALSLVIETGIPGLLFFTGLCLLPVWYGLRGYLSDMSESSALAGALACSFLAFTANRLVLSQKENHMLIFSLLAIVIVLNYERFRKQVPQRTNPKTLQAAHSQNHRLQRKPSMA
jgi:O-antigen ligase